MTVPKKKIVFITAFILLILVSSCRGKKYDDRSLEEVRTGTEGISVAFMQNTPPERINVVLGDKNEFDVILELKNRGAYPQADEPQYQVEIGNLGRLYLSGFDRKVIEFDKNSIDLNDKMLEGKSTANPYGGSDTIHFEGRINTENLNVEKYEQNLLATVCYNYHTIASPTVCIDPNPYSSEKKICKAQDITLSSQGAPVAIAKVEEEVFATKTQFKITIKNLGKGNIIKASAVDKCNPYGGERLDREDLDMVFIQEAKVSNVPLHCGPFEEGAVRGVQGFVRLINGEGSVVCDLQRNDYGNAPTAYKTPLNILLGYVYRSTAEKRFVVKKESVLEQSSKDSAQGDLV